jgi:hypothetical protein
MIVGGVPRERSLMEARSSQSRDTESRTSLTMRQELPPVWENRGARSRTICGTRVSR